MKKNILLISLLFQAMGSIATAHKHHTSHHWHSSHHATHAAGPSNNTQQQPYNPNNQQPYNPNNNQQAYDPNNQINQGGIGMSNPNIIDQKTITKTKTLDANKVKKVLSELKNLQHNEALLHDEIEKHITIYASPQSNLQNISVKSTWNTTLVNANVPTSYYKIPFLNSKEMNFKTKIINKVDGSILPGESVNTTINPFTGEQVTLADMHFLQCYCDTLDRLCQMYIYGISLDIAAKWNSEQAPNSANLKAIAMSQFGGLVWGINGMPDGFWTSLNSLVNNKFKCGLNKKNKNK